MGNINFYQVIIGILFILGVVFIYFYVSGKNKDKSGSEGTTVAPNNAPSQKAGKDLSDEELIAVLTAAVMAMQSNPDIKIKVTSFRRIPQSAPVWNTIGRRERLENKL